MRLRGEGRVTPRRILAMRMKMVDYEYFDLVSILVGANSEYSFGITVLIRNFV